MFLGIRKKYWLLLAASVGLMSLVCFAHISPVFAWRQTEVAGPGTDKLAALLATHPDSGKNLFGLDKETLIKQCLIQTDIDNITMRFRLPHGLAARANRFNPVALVWNKKMYGLDDYCRIIPFDSAWENTDLPILTGLKFRRLFALPDDSRIVEVVSGLKYAGDNMPDLFRQIAEIDFSDKFEILIYLTTSQAVFTATGDGFAAQMSRLAVVSGLEDWSETGRYNLQYNEVVIRER